jgi:hypothetical protein
MTPDLVWWGRLAAFLAAQSAVIAGAAMLVNYKIRAAQARRAVWQAAVVAMACVWLGESAGLGEKWRALWPREERGIMGGLGRMGLDEKDGIAPRAGQFTTVATTPAARMRAEPRPPVRREEPAAPVMWPGEVWLLGTLALLVRAAANRGWLAWQRHKMALADVETQETVARLRAALGLSGVELRTWARLRGPIAFGWRRPTVALPRGFSLRFTPGRREAMLAHELAHLAAGDPLWLALADTVCALAWWNPPAWWAAAQLRAASEAAADEASALVPAGPAALAESLLRFGRELAESGPARGLGVAGNGFRSGLGRRVKVLLTTSVAWRELPAAWRWSPRILAAIFVVALTSLPVITGPSGSVAGLLVSSARAEFNSQQEILRNSAPAVEPAGKSVPYTSFTNFFGEDVIKEFARLNDVEFHGLEDRDGTNVLTGGQQTQPATPPTYSLTSTNQGAMFKWGDFAASTNPPVAFPSGTSLAEAESRIANSASNAIGYSFDRSFVNYFGGAETNAVNSAFAVLNGTAPEPMLTTGLMETNSTLNPTTSNAAPARKVIVLQVKMTEIAEGSPAQAMVDKLFLQLPPDESAGLEVLAQYLHEAKIVHTENIRADYRITKDEAGTLTSEPFKATLETFERQSGCDILTLPKMTLWSGIEGRLESVEVMTLVTATPPSVGATNLYVGEELRTGVTARIRATAAADGWNLTVLSRQNRFLGYDRPHDWDKSKTVTPLPHLRISEIQGKGTVRTGETLVLRGPAFTETKVMKSSVLGIFHRTRTETARQRLYLFVTAISETN